MTHLLHHHPDPRFGTVDVILDATFTELNVADCSSHIFAAAKRARRRIAVVQRRFGGTSYISYSPAEEDKVAMALIASLTAILGGPLDAGVTVQSGQYDRY